MKTKLRALLSATLILTFSWLTAAGCKKAPDETVAPAATKTSFNEVTSQLDPGGELYIYLGTEQVLNNLSGKIAKWRGTFTSMPDPNNEVANVLKGFDIVTNLISESGIEDVSGFGMSTISVEPGFYRTKSVLHHYPGKGNGFLWNLSGQKPHALTGLDLSPATTAFAIFSDLDVNLVWSVIEKQVNESGFSEAQEFLRELPGEFQEATGLQWRDTLQSFGGEFGFIITLDDSKMITIPLPGGEPLQVPEPGIMIVLKMKNDAIFARIEAAINESGMPSQKVDQPGLKMRTVPVPLPLPIQLRPSIATTDEYLLIATSDSLIQTALAVKKGDQPGLKTTEEFKRLAKGIPEQGNQFSFLSQRFGKTFVALQKQALEMSAKSDGGDSQWIQSLLNPDGSGFAYSVSAHTDQGFVTVGNGNQHPAKILAAAATVPIGMLGAIAIPNFVKARAAAQKNACINNLRMIDGAKMQWALENNKDPNAVPTRQEVAEWLHNANFPVCPQNGEYKIGSIDTQPTCSIPGHELPEY